MGIKISQGFERRGAFPIDDDLLLTKAEMLTVNDGLMPDKYFTICQDDGKLYLYDKENTFDTDTGKFRVLEGGSGSHNYSDLINKPQINSVELDGNKSGEDLRLTLSVQEIEKILYLP